jgi:macrolide-specific efflux system membrane fusion protein
MFKTLKSRPLTLLIVALVLAWGSYEVLQRFVFTSAGDVEYQTAEVTRGDIEVTISSAGKITPKEEVLVGAQVSGQLMDLLVEIGDPVEKGDLLAQIDPTIAMTNVEADRAQLKETQASRTQQQATLTLAEANAERAQMLYNADAMARADYEAAQAEFEVAKGRLAAIDAQIERQSSTLQANLATLEFTKIYAPISGTVVSLEADEGQTLNANQTAPTILTIADLSVMTVETDVSEADVLRIEAGQDAYFTTLGDADRRWETRVRQVLPTPEVLNDVVLYKALLDVENPEGRLRSQMTAQVFFVTGSAENAVLVPIAALQDAPTGQPQRPAGEAIARGERDRGARLMQAQASTAAEDQRGNDQARLRAARSLNPDAEPGLVMVLDDTGTANPQRVLVGLKTRTTAEIIYGLSPGQTVVTGNVSVARPRARDENNENRDRSTQMGRRGSGRR